MIPFHSGTETGCTIFANLKIVVNSPSWVRKLWSVSVAESFSFCVRSGWGPCRAQGGKPTVEKRCLHQMCLRLSTCLPMISRVKENVLGGEVRLAGAPALVSFAFWAGLRCRGRASRSFVTGGKGREGCGKSGVKTFFQLLEETSNSQHGLFS